MKVLLLLVMFQTPQTTSLDTFREKILYYGRHGHLDSISNLKSIYLRQPLDSALLVEIYQMTANAFIHNRQLDSSFYYYDLASQIAASIGQLEKAAAGYSHLGGMQANALLFENAIYSLTKSVALHEKLHQNAEVTHLLVSISDLNIKMGNSEIALSTAKQAASMADKTSDPRSQALAIMQMSQALLARGDMHEALLNAEKARQLYLNLGQFYGLAQVEGILANIYIQLGDGMMSLQHADNYLNMAQKSGSVHESISALVLKGEVLIQLGKSDSAVVFLQRALELCANNPYLEKEMRANYLLFKAYDSDQQVAQSFVHLKRYHQLKDSSISVQQLEIIERMQATFNLKTKDRELEHLKTNAELQALKIQQTENRLIVFFLSFLLIVIIGYVVFRYRLVRQKWRHAKEKEELTRVRFKSIMDAEEQERKRVARELHDGLGQMLSTSRLFISSIEDRKINPKIDRALEVLDTTIEEVRTISHNLMPTQLMELGLTAALEDLVKKLSLTGSLTLKTSGLHLLQLESSTSIAVYRTVQEIINNAIKYAQATTLELNVNQTSQGLTIVIQDNGKGFNTEQIANSKGIGWRNIYARMDLIGAEVLVKSSKEEGTSVSLVLPIAFG